METKGLGFRIWHRFGVLGFFLGWNSFFVGVEAKGLGFRVGYGFSASGFGVQGVGDHMFGFNLICGFLV